VSGLPPQVRLAPPATWDQPGDQAGIEAGIELYEKYSSLFLTPFVKTVPVLNKPDPIYIEKRATLNDLLNQEKYYLRIDTKNPAP
jgi:hypothetical protein